MHFLNFEIVVAVVVVVVDDDDDDDGSFLQNGWAAQRLKPYFQSGSLS